MLLPVEPLHLGRHNVHSMYCAKRRLCHYAPVAAFKQCKQIHWFISRSLRLLLVAVRIINNRFYIYIFTDYVRLNVVLKIEVHKVVELELEQPISTVTCSNEITIILKNN